MLQIKKIFAFCVLSLLVVSHEAQALTTKQANNLITSLVEDINIIINSSYDNKLFRMETTSYLWQRREC